MTAQIRDFAIADYGLAIAMWQSEASVGLSSADSQDAVARFLARNPGLSKVVVVDGQLAGTLLCGHDARRGYLYHLYVAPQFRRRGLGSKLVDACLQALGKEGILKCHLFIFRKNESGKLFWKSAEWIRRADIEVFSRDVK